MSSGLTLVQRMDRRYYPGFEDSWDDKRLRDVISEYVRPNFSVLDFGAGRGNATEMNFRGRVERMAGVDVDDAVLMNPFLDESFVVDPAGPLPFPAGSFDVIFSDNAVEHVDDPDGIFEELRRVLKPGGVLIAKTPNKYHYMPTIARATPVAFHRWYNRLRGRDTHDTFPTRYRCNSRSRIATLARSHGFSVERLETWEGRPEYLRLSGLTYVFGLAYERLVNSSDAFSGLRCVLLFVLRKPVEDRHE